MSDTDTASSSTSSSKSWVGKLGCPLLLILPAIILLPIWFFFLGPKLRHDRLLENGIQGPGRLLTVEETGTVVNDAPELELVVEFRRQDGVLDTAVTDFVPTLRTLHFYQKGIAVTVAYDPEDPEEITIVNLSTGPAPLPMTTSPEVTASIDSLKHLADSLLRMADSLRRGMGAE